MANPAHPKESTPYGQALALAKRFGSQADLRLLSPTVLHAYHDALQALNVDGPGRMPGKALLKALKEELVRRQRNAAGKAATDAVLRRFDPPAGAYSRALWGVETGPAPKKYSFYA